MADEYRETTTTSWGQRIISSFAGIIIGVLLFIGAFPLIFWNEGRSVDRIKTLDEGRGLVVHVAPDKLDPANEGKLIHATGTATTMEILRDRLFGIEENALKLRRSVEMYQWKESKHSETKQNLGGSETTETTHSYDKVWAENRIDSSKFKKRDGHQNPTMPYQSETYTAETITVGAMTLSEPFVEQLNDFETYPLSDENFEAMSGKLKSKFKLDGNHYVTAEGDDPQVGALRVSFGSIKPSQISVIGKQENGSLQSYYTKNGDISLLESGNVSADAMFASAESENKIITWLIRLGSYLMMWIGLSMVFGPIKVFGDVVPFIGGLLGAGIGLVAGVITLALSTIAIALAWIVFRPVIGITLLVLACVFFFGGFRMIKNKLKPA